MPAPLLLAGQQVEGPAGALSLGLSDRRLRQDVRRRREVPRLSLGPPRRLRLRSLRRLQTRELQVFVLYEYKLSSASSTRLQVSPYPFLKDIFISWFIPSPKYDGMVPSRIILMNRESSVP